MKGACKMNNVQKAQETRIRNQEARSRLYREQAAAISAARQALQQVFEAKDATADQVLKAAELLVKLSNH